MAGMSSAAFRLFANSSLVLESWIRFWHLDPWNFRRTRMSAPVLHFSDIIWMTNEKSKVKALDNLSACLRARVLKATVFKRVS